MTREEHRAEVERQAVWVAAQDELERRSLLQFFIGHSPEIVQAYRALHHPEESR